MSGDRKRCMAEYWSIGTVIGLCAAGGILLGALLNNLTLWLCIGAGVGAVLGAVLQVNQNKRDRN